MFKSLKNNRGDIATPILTVLGIITITAFLVLTFEKLAPAATYMKVNQVARKYSLIMENEGGLSSQNKTRMINELAQKGVIVGESNIWATESAEYGKDLTLAISFDFASSDLMVSGFQISKTQAKIPMSISRSTVSRRYNN